MKKFILDLIVKENEHINEDYFVLKLTSNNKLPHMLPGQFVEIKIENSPTTFLRRPISVNFYDKKLNELWLLIQVVGDGTRKLSEVQAGDTLNLILPLGNTFSIPKDKNARLLLIGGGVGFAPMLFLGAYLNDLGYNCEFLLGGRSEANMVQLNEFKRYGEVYTTTEDGSMGEKGYVTQHSLLQKKQFDMIYTCGPTPMMQAVASYAHKRNIACEVSLENMMACGFGTCLCCVTDTVDGNLCVCTEGPVFNITKLKWQI